MDDTYKKLDENMDKKMDEEMKKMGLKFYKKSE